MKLKELYNGIQVPDQSNAEQDIENVKCALRFPFFNKEWANDDVDFYEGEALDHFPVISEVWSLLNTDMYNVFPKSPGDAYFWKFLKGCSAQEIYFLDSYFSSKNLLRLWDVLKGMDRQCDRWVTDVCVYTVRGHEWDGLKNEFYELLKGDAKFDKITLTICCLDAALSGKLHDRFALLGKSLWHFGASAGAMHTNINAYSGPWPDKNGKCLEFMRSVRKQKHFLDEVSTIPEGVRV